MSARAVPASKTSACAVAGQTVIRREARMLAEKRTPRIGPCTHIMDSALGGRIAVKKGGPVIRKSACFRDTVTMGTVDGGTEVVSVRGRVSSNGGRGATLRGPESRPGSVRGLLEFFRQHELENPQEREKSDLCGKVQPAFCRLCSVGPAVRCETQSDSPAFSLSGLRVSGPKLPSHVSFCRVVCRFSCSIGADG